jgi:peroxiredoxin
MSTALTPRDTIITPGSMAPLFELPTSVRGENWKLADALKQGEVILSFFPMAFTGVCGTEMECITKEFGKLQGKGAQAVGISCDSGPALGAWRQQLGLSHTLLSDMHRQVCRAYGLFWPEMNIAWRGTYIISPDGRVKWAQKREIPAAFSLDEVLTKLG